MQRAVLILAGIFICVDCLSQQYPFVHYTPKDGLVNSRVRKAYQDSKGRMYFLTYGGLSVFDGTRFRNYTMQQGLATNLVNDVLEVGDDSLLVATNSGYYLNVLVKGKIGRLKTEGVPLPVINQFYRNDQGNIYLSSDNGLFVMQNKKIAELDISLLSKNSPLQPYLGTITGKGNYLVISTNEMKDHKGLYLYDIKNNSICNALPESESFLLGKDKSGCIWVTRSDKLFILDTVALARGVLLLVPPLGGYKQAEDYSVSNVAFDKNCIWLVYRNENYRNVEIHRIEMSGDIFRMPLPEQATSSDIQNIIVDREKTIWLSNDGEGVFKIVNSPLQIFQSPFGKESQADNAFYSNDITWYRCNGNKLYKKSEKGLEEFSCNLIKSPVVFQQDGSKLLAVDSRNIYEADLTSRNIIYFRKAISLPEPDQFGAAQVVDNKGVIFASQKSGLGVWKDHQLVSQIPMARNEGIERIFLDKDNLLWVVWRYAGIDIFSLHPENIPKYLQLIYHFTNDKIIGSPRSCIIDKTGLVWIGTRDDGLVAYQHTGNRLNPVYHFNVSNGLTDNFVTSLACDSQNNIIAGTQTGLDRIAYYENSYRVENLSKNSNFFAYIKQVWVDGRNQACALTSTGVFLQLSPSFPKKETTPPQLLLEEIKVNTQSVASFKKKFLYKENNISFLLAAPSFIDEKQVTYSYLLEGSGNIQWSDTTSANAVINLTNLSSGNYRLKVKAFFPSMSYSPAELSYPFEITPPWWQTWWFRIIIGLSIIGLLIVSIRIYYQRKLAKQKIILEKRQAVEKERTRISTDMHDDLGAGLSRIKFLSQSILNKKIKDDFIKTELEKITFFSDEMSEKMGEIVWALNEKNDTLADLIAYSRSYAVEYLANHNIQCEADTPLHLPATFITGEMRRNIFLSVKECLHNIVKHAGATRVCFSVQLKKMIQISIHDNGKGIDWNNRRAFSNGIENIEKRMKEINGEAKFLNDHGTKVLLTIPFIL